MVAAISNRLLISHIILRGPEIQQIYMAIEVHQRLDWQELYKTFVAHNDTEDPFKLEEATLREALNFLVISRMIRRRKQKKSLYFFIDPKSHGLAFPLALLTHVHQHPDKRQQAISLIYQQLIAHDTLSITQQQLRDEQERGPYRELFTWTSEKISFWTHLAMYLGLIYRLERENVLIIAPQPELLLLAIKQVLATPEPTSSIMVCLQRISQLFFACFSSNGRVHGGITQTLVAMHRLGMIHLSHQDDAVRSLVLGNWRVSEIALPTQEAVQ
jgi:hypothetical protein